MFDKQIRLYGKHADILKKYSKDKQGENEVRFEVDNNEGSKKTIYIFDSMLQCYMVAAMLGINNKKKAEVDSDKNKYATIFADIIIKNRSNLQRIYSHMILTDDSIDDVDAKIKKAFSIKSSDSDSEQDRLDSFVRGGLELIDEYFGNCASYEDVSNSILDLLDGIVL